MSWVQMFKNIIVLLSGVIAGAVITFGIFFILFKYG
jgi:hypothetical protein